MVCGVKIARSRSVPVEIIVVWAVMLVVCVEVLVAYTRTKPNELIGVPRTGLSVAVTDAIGFLAFPVGLVATGVAIAIGDRLSRVGLWVAMAAATGLAVVSVLPGVAESEEVEITLNPQRVVAAAAVLALFGLTLHAVRIHGVGHWGPRSPGDLVRLALAAGITFAALPWVAADLTLSLDNVPGLSHVFLTDTLRNEPGRVGANPAVHDGHHHGMDGALLALAAIALSRVIRSLAGWRQTALTALVSLTFVYGVANALEDFWLEQIVKRGASGYVFPKMLTPRLSTPFLVIVLAAVALSVALRATTPPDQPAPMH